MSGDPESRYEAALAERELEDVRPLYRELLVRLRDRDEEAYEEGVRRYDEDVAPAVADAGDPLAPWLAYGAWLAGRLAAGRLCAVAPDGRAVEADELPPEALEPRVLLLHLPDDDGTPALPLAVPADPSDHQAATRELLCG